MKLLTALPFACLAFAATDFDAASAILRAKCLGCHSAKTRTAGLSLETRADILRGGKSGGAIMPGRPVDSLLMSMISSGKMPPAPGAKLGDAEIAAVRQWIEREDAKPPVEERDVQAILSAKCWVCHGRREKSAGLDLRTRDALVRGGKSGAAIAPGNPDASLLVKRIVAQEMPPPKLQEQFSVRGLTDGELAKVKQWIADGAPAGIETPLDGAPVDNRGFWSFQTPRRPAVPAMPADGRNAIDAFLGPTAVPEASPGALLRRAYFDLTGLPPALAEAAAPPASYERLIDALLESPHYGERQARFWLDAAGYADSEGGNNSDQARQHAWRYRDYVIRAFNANTPYDRFLTEQIAGDELFDYRSAKEHTLQQLEWLAATGFWRMAPDGTNSTEQNFVPERMDVIAGQIEVFGSAVMGLSIGCARCHDHKYDPLPTRDYYRLVAILTPAYDPYQWLPGEFPCGGVGAKCDEHNTRYILPATKEYADAAAHNRPIDARIEALRSEIEAKAAPYRARLLAEKGVKDAPLRDLETAFDEFKKDKLALETRMRNERAQRKPPPLIRALFDLGPEPPPARILLRGDVSTPGALVTAGVPAAVAASVKEPYRAETLAHSSGRRLALARWLTQPDHPLTARVMVNRIWQQHFGAGLVTTPGNFGKMGAAPENQALLDFLATEFVRTGWDIKAMHRLIMTSAAYRRRAGGAGGFPLRRIDAESVRDAMLAIAGRLDTKAFGTPEAIKQLSDGEVITESRRRSIYIAQRRLQPVSLLDTFDQPFMNPNCVQRGQSTVSSQALHLMNGDLARENARYMAGRIIDSAGGGNPAAQVEEAYLRALGRRPGAEEAAAALRAMQSAATEWRKQLAAEQPAEPVDTRADWLGLATVCHTLINSAEFLYVD